MESFLRYWLVWPVVENFLRDYGWGWSMAETAHFIGLILLIGAVGMFDLRVLGMAKGLPIGPLRQLLPWGVFGFVLCVISGGMFVTGFQANLPIHPYDVLMTDPWLQLKLLFIFFAGVNLLAFYLTGMSRKVDGLGRGDDAPPLAKVIAGTSLFLWIGVIYFGRLIPWAL
jgi:hypothetical protein